MIDLEHDRPPNSVPDCCGARNPPERCDCETAHRAWLRARVLYRLPPGDTLTREQVADAVLAERLRILAAIRDALQHIALHDKEAETLWEAVASVACDALPRIGVYLDAAAPATKEPRTP